MFDQNGGRKYLSSAERRAFVRILERVSDLPRRTFLLTLFYTGCRISEALNLLTSRIDVAAGAVTFETLKRRRPGCFRSVPIPNSLIRSLRTLAASRMQSDRVWKFSRSTGYRIVKAAMREAHISGTMACPKGLRHGHAVACVAVKIPLPLIQRWFGHAQLETTAIYLDVLGEEEKSLAKRLW